MSDSTSKLNKYTLLKLWVAVVKKMFFERSILRVIKIVIKLKKSIFYLAEAISRKKESGVITKPSSAHNSAMLTPRVPQLILTEACTTIIAANKGMCRECLY